MRVVDGSDIEEVLLEDVFKTSGVPTYTFVTPSHNDRLLVALRSPGRGVVIEGPSGIGKSTAVEKCLRQLDLDQSVIRLSARRPSDLEYIQALPTMSGFGIVVIDDFHRLAAEDQHELADLLKILADTEDRTSKLVIIGINQAGANLIEFAPDLSNRIDRIRFESEPDDKIREMISNGEQALHITLTAADSVIDGSHGSFYIAQLLCHELCVQQGITERQAQHTTVRTLYSSARRQVMERQNALFGSKVKDFVRGPRFRPGGRAPYFHVLKWLAESPAWSIDLEEEIKKHANEKVSVRVVVDQGYLEKLCANPDIASILYYNSDAKALTAEDPHLVFYLKNLDWAKFVKDVGFTNVSPDKPYDIALSFAGEDREFANLLRNYLEEFGLAVFYDKSEESQILASDVQALLKPVYESDSSFVVVVLGEKYGVKKWTLFESSAFKHRIEKNEVVPIYAIGLTQSAFDPLLDRGGRTFDPRGDLDAQAKDCAEAIAKMVAAANSGSR